MSSLKKEKEPLYDLLGATFQIKKDNNLLNNERHFVKIINADTKNSLISVK